jgi:hypothetical protein
MLDVELLPRTVELVGDCADPECLKFAAELRMKLQPPKYTQGVSTMENPATLEQWRSEHRTARKRSDRCERRGYAFSEISYREYDDDMYEINTSLERRQGRPMSDGYTRRITHGRLPDYPCDLHNIRTYGVLAPRRDLVAYMTLYRCCELALVSMILGHGDHLANEIMYLLFAGMIQDQAGHPGVIYYNRWDSGRDGLRFYKERVGFTEGSVEWIL